MFVSARSSRRDGGQRFDEDGWRETPAAGYFLGAGDLAAF
jgi:hypothetical protein